MTDTKIKYIQASQEFKEAFDQINTKTDPCRYIWIKWVGYQMWKIFDEESGLNAINVQKKYEHMMRRPTPADIRSAEHEMNDRPRINELKRGLYLDSD